MYSILIKFSISGNDNYYFKIGFNQFFRDLIKGYVTRFNVTNWPYKKNALCTDNYRFIT